MSIFGKKIANILSDRPKFEERLATKVMKIPVNRLSKPMACWAAKEKGVKSEKRHQSEANC